jgi:hypothetical protein
LFVSVVSTPKKTDNFSLASAQTEKQQKQIEFWFVLVPTEKNLLFRGHPNRERFLEIILYVSKKFCLFRLFRYWSETLKKTETNQKKFLVSRNKPKTTETD